MIVSKKLNLDMFFDILNNFTLFLILIIVMYPLYFVFIASFSDPNAINNGEVIFFPVRPSLAGYTNIINESKLWIGYRNTFFYTVSGTFINVLMTLLAGYALSRHNLAGRNVIMGYLVFTMYFSGGLIPTYMLVNKLGLYDTPWIMIILGAVSVYNIIIARSFFQQTVPTELLEASFIDGCGNFNFFIKIVLPLSKAVTAVLVLYYAIGHWNSFFNALIYLSRSKLFPLQLVLREILISNQISAQMFADGGDAEILAQMQKYAELIKYATIVVASLPILLLYPFIQRYFVKGVMIGSIKG